LFQADSSIEMEEVWSLIEIEGEIERAYTEFKQRHRGLSRVPSMLVR